jgi:hypothetical protein
VAATGLGEREVEIRLTVYGFAITPGKHLQAWVPLYMTRMWKGERLDTLGEREAVEVLWAYERMARAHGFDTQLKEDEPEIEWDAATGRMLEVDWREYDLRNGPILDGSIFGDGDPPALWKVGGGHWWGARPGDPPNFGGSHKVDSSLTAAHRRALGAYVAEIESHFAKRGWTRPRLFMYWVDEPDFEEHPNYAPLIKEFGGVLKESGSRIGQLLTANPEESPIVQGAVDIWATWGAGYVPSQMRRRQEAGDLTWFYQQHEPFVGGSCVNDEGLGMRSWSWIAWRYGVGGIFLWAGNFWNADPYRDPRNWSKNLLGNGVLFYPGAQLQSLGLTTIHGPVSSFRMKSMRRGLQDYEYFHLLRSLGGDADAVVARVVRSALNEKGWRPHWTHPRWGQHGDWSHDPLEWDTARRDVAAEIVRRTASRSAAAGAGGTVAGARQP